MRDTLCVHGAVGVSMSLCQGGGRQTLVKFAWSESWRKASVFSAVERVPSQGRDCLLSLMGSGMIATFVLQLP